MAAEEIPQVAPGIPEHADAAVGLVADRPNHVAARVLDAGQGAVEVLDAQEQPDPAGELAADEGGLLVTIGAGEDESSAAVGRLYDDPPLRAPVGRHGQGSPPTGRTPVGR